MIDYSPNANILDSAVLQDVVDGNLRITPNQAMQLYHEMPLPELGRWADARCRVLHGNHLRTYVIDRNINYTMFAPLNAPSAHLEGTELSTMHTHWNMTNC